LSLKFQTKPQSRQAKLLANPLYFQSHWI
jgi:hypothetical protein